MAYYERRSKNTYKLITCQGYDVKGKKIRKSKSVKLSDSLTEKQREKELNRLLTLFEEEVQNGNYLDGNKITFADFTKTWLDNYGKIKLAPATYVSYKTKLEHRILPAIGHIKLGKMQPTNLLQFYQKLNDDNIRLDGKYTPDKELCKILRPYTVPQLEKMTGITFKTCQRLQRGKDTDYKTAKRICLYFKLDFKKMFTYTQAKNLSEKTIRTYMGVISVILSTAVKWNIIKDNPAQRVDYKKAKKSKVRYYDDEQIADMLDALKNEPLMYAVMVYLAIDTGMRKGELAGLKWSDVDFEKSTININKQRNYVTGYGVLESPPKTDAGIRTVTISQTVLNLLKSYKKEQLQNRLKFGNAWKNEPYVFLHEDGSAIYPNRPYMWFTNFLKRHNLPKITFHQLRHSNASLLISSGEDVVTVSGRLGHSDKSITLNTYSHIIKSKEAQVANKMDKFYSSLSSLHINAG